LSDKHEKRKGQKRTLAKGGQLKKRGKEPLVE